MTTRPPADGDALAGPPAKRPAAEVFAELRAKNAARRARAAELVALGPSIRMAGRDGKLILVGPDVAAPGQFRITYFDGGVPTGHTEHDTLEAALNEALIYGFETCAGVPRGPVMGSAGQSLDAPGPV